MKYSTPVITDCGKSEEVIKGECGWGVENWTLDQTGTYKTQKRKSLPQTSFPAGTTYYICRTVTGCSSEADECS